MSQEQAKQFIEQATQSLQNGQFQQALELLDQAIALAPTDSEAQTLRGIALSQSGQPNEATEAFRQAIMLSPYNAKAYYNLAVHQYALGNKVEALEMSREAAKIDPRHAGARQLMTTIEGELHTPVSPLGNRPVNPNDPLSTPAPVPPPDTSGLPPGVTGAITPPTAGQDPLSGPPIVASGGVRPPEQPVVQAPQSQSAAQQSPYASQQPPGTVYRQGYERSSEHSLPWVANMGGAWVAIGWVLAALSLTTFLLSIATLGPMIMEVMRNPQAAANMNRGASPVLTILGWTSLLGGILFTVIDLVDRRGSFLWIIPQALCGCCGFTWLVLPIYMLAGRKG